MIVYMDRTGRRLKAFKWRQLIRQPDYVYVARTVLDNVDVSTSWLGVYAEGTDKRPYLFITMATIRDPLDMDKDKDLLTLWAANEQEALARHSEAMGVVKDLLEGKVIQ